MKEEGSPGKKKTTNGKDKEKKKPHPKISLVHQDSEGSSKKGLDLSSCSLILFEEVFEYLLHNSDHIRAI